MFVCPPHTSRPPHVWGSDDELGHAFHHVGSEDQVQVLGCDSKQLYQLSHLASGE